MERRLWTREEFILVLNLYYKLPFGKLNHTTKEVQELAKLLGRTESSIALRLVNFAACDPYILATGRHGMQSGAKQCQPYWDEFNSDREALLFESEKILAGLEGTTVEQKYKKSLTHIGELKGEDRLREVQTRVNQNVFRKIILSNYDWKCALSGIDIPELLVASHIKPWAVCEQERLNPENGICLSSLYDDCFDKGLIGFDSDYKVVMSRRITENCDKNYFANYFEPIRNRKLILPEEHKPDQSFLEWHMDEVFQR